MAASLLNRLVTLALVCFASTALVGQQTDYVVGPQDVLTLTIYADPDLSGRYTVESDGHFTFPLIGRVRAAGLTIQGVEAALKAMLADGFFKDPQLSVAVEVYRSQRVFIVGHVSRPGPYPLTGQMTLLEALALAGPMGPAVGDEIVIARPKQGGGAQGPVLPDQADVVEVVRVDLRQLQSGALFQGTKLRDGDTIFVPGAESIYVFGQVRNPGAYPLQRGTTVLQALTLAGGVTDRGATNRIKIARTVDGTKKEIDVKLTDLVQPGDTIIVRERIF